MVGGWLGDWAWTCRDEDGDGGGAGTLVTGKAENIPLAKMAAYASSSWSPENGATLLLPSSCDAGLPSAPSNSLS